MTTDRSGPDPRGDPGRRPTTPVCLVPGCSVHRPAGCPGPGRCRPDRGGRPVSPFVDVHCRPGRRARDGHLRMRPDHSSRAVRTTGSWSAVPHRPPSPIRTARLTTAPQRHPGSQPIDLAGRHYFARARFLLLAWPVRPMPSTFIEGSRCSGTSTVSRIGTSPAPAPDQCFPIIVGGWLAPAAENRDPARRTDPDGTDPGGRLIPFEPETPKEGTIHDGSLF